MSKFYSMSRKVNMCHNTRILSWFSATCISPGHCHCFQCRWGVKVQMNHLIVFILIYVAYSKISSSHLKSHPYICVKGLVSFILEKMGNMEVTQVRKDMMGHLVFWSNTYCVGNKFWYKNKFVASLDYKQPTYLLVKNNTLACTPFESCWIPAHCLSIGILCSLGTVNEHCTWIKKRRNTKHPILHVSPPLTCMFPLFSYKS